MEEENKVGPDPQTGDELRHCVMCRQPFWLRAGQREWFLRMEYQPPKRCEACRAARRIRPEGPIER
jgi:hypothetical protein